MKKENVKIKSSITIVDEISTIQSIVEYYFTDGEYTPYYADMAKITAVAQNFLDGIEFDPEDYVCQLVMENDDIYECVKKFLEIPSSQDKEDVNCYVLMERIMKQVKDIVEFEKQKMIHGSDTIKAIGDLCNSITTVFNNIAEINSPENVQMAKDFMEEIEKNGVTEETLANAARKAANQFKMPNNEIIEGQRQRIAEQQQQLQEQQAKIEEMKKRVKEMDSKVQSFETWKREYMARNVKAVKGSGKIVAGSKNKTSGKNSKNE